MQSLYHLKYEKPNLENYDRNELIGITGVDVFREYPETIWLDWFTILPQYRRKGYGKKVLLDTIQYCKKLNRFDTFRVEITYYEGRPALFLYDKVMQIKEDYTIEDTDTIIYSYSLNYEKSNSLTLIIKC